jgi:hypothetical protein
MGPIRQPDIDRLARMLAAPGSRRCALAAVGALVLGVPAGPLAAKKRRSPSSTIKNKRKRAERRRDGKDRGGSKDKSGKDSFPRDCRRFVLAGGPDRDDKFKHVDDDVIIELIPKGKKGDRKILLEDDNGSPNGNNGAHLKVNPFTAKVGDKIHIVARNAVTGGCELDEIWIHCVEGKGGRVRISDAVTPSECRGDAGKVGIFLDRTVRIKN